MAISVILALVFIVLWVFIGFLPSLIISGILSIVLVGVFGLEK